MKTLLFIITIAATSNLYAQQNIAYYYDNAGNRTQRKQCACVGNKTGNTTPADASNSLSASILPNPTQGNLVLKVTEKGMDLEDEATHFHVVVYDLAGREILNQQHYAPTFNIDITPQPAGVYFVKLFTENKVKQWEVVKN